MDIVRKKQKNFTPIIKWAVIAVVIISCIWALTYASNRGHKVSANNVLFDTVQSGDLTLDVRGIGVLVPKEVYWVATEVNGRVDKVFKKAGAAVKKDDLIISMKNSSLTQQLEESQWELEETKAQLNAQRVALESQVLDQETLVINSQLNYESALLTLNAQKTLLSQGIVAISKVEHEEVKIEVEQLLQRWQLEKKRYAKAQENLVAQKRAFNARLKRMERGTARIQHLVNSLEIRASIDSIVQEMPLELGQQITAGTNVARLARNDEFIAEIRVPEKQIYQIGLTQAVTLDTKTSKVSGEVIRIDPSVVNGSVQVDVAITGTLPKEARPELSVDGIIHVAHLTNTLYVKRPMYAKANESSAVYVVNTENNSVALRDVTFGRSSQTHIEIISGLSVGENVVVSNVSSWKDKQINAIQ
ncbi:HlyD family efflux transporter periplasmic adaptor subunit [Thalassotalea sp. 1_MG-2023]|uniref:efflux RND transporter periplasmic adaptor subunit n=1 Tax=Thalassotalea sp. 1_MG-2023 TaxID=3062680 RepID=UPI0026E244BD|nr:HlyD family efflux transporter periplasmic adaptor subunit [Thalassotalea sp. 1_MG-2023]MDO6428203.1 HlyD family efflux transporter periplasmic adaptor subunit [Thalassotalea sp. 1_MG-2023]